MLEISKRGHAAHLIRLTPNRSITGPQLLAVFMGLAVACIGFAAVLAVQGYWPSLPFAGAEILALALALRAVRRYQAATEEIRIDADQVSVRRTGVAASGPHRFQRAWLKIELRPGRYRWYPRRLVLASHGRELELGRFLSEAERKQLAERLNELTAG